MTIIRVDNLSKRFEINAAQTHSTLRAQLAHSLRSITRRGSPQQEDRDFIWALRDVSFDLQPGEVLGIVGQNGSGKSTLLKIISRITPPTIGRVIIRGRVASLLEVGTGFHPELSGRENIYMNAAILGMSRQEIRRKFDEIVAFAEVERFIDTPIKRYSSGMYMRLAFSVAAHLEQEILVVDEVLAVGDASFQKKSLGKMEDVSHQGRTVLFVSHNMGALTALCPRSIWLNKGKLMMDGPTGEVIREYVKTNAVNKGEVCWEDIETAPGSEKTKLHRVRVISDNEVTADVDIQKDITLEFEFWNLKPGEKVTTGIYLINGLGVDVLTSANLPSANLTVDEWYDTPHPVGLFRTRCTIPGNFLNDGRYTVDVSMTTNLSHLQVHMKNVITFNVYESGGMSKEYMGAWRGAVRPRLAWQTEQIGELEPTS